MTLKELVFAARQHLLQSTGTKLSAGHTYELLAAGLRFNSYAALTSHAALVSLYGMSLTHAEDLLNAPLPEADQLKMRERLKAIGAPGAPQMLSDSMASFISDQRLLAVRFSDVIEHHKGANVGLPDDAPRSPAVLLGGSMEQLVSPERMGLTLTMMEEACTRIPDLHYGLAQLYYTLVEFDLAEPYWYLQEQSGVKLAGVQKEWADAYRRQESIRGRYEFHIRAAAAAGFPEAILVVLNEFGGDKAPMQSLRNCLHPVDNLRAAQIAVDTGHLDEAEHWFRLAAVEGEIIAMRWLVLSAESAPTVETWTWVYFSRLLGDDVCASTMRAYHEGGEFEGEEYSDDIGGPIYIEGDEQLELEKLPDELDRQAQEAANQLFRQMEQM